jgi:Holliday junction resolvase
VSSRSANKGREGENQVKAIFEAAGFEQVVRGIPGAAHDRGDLAGVPELTIEVKNIDDLAVSLARGTAELAIEKVNNRTPWGVLAMKRRRKGWIAVMPLEEFAEMYAAFMKEKGRIG